jgi:hypothetical protein
MPGNLKEIPHDGSRHRVAVLYTFNPTTGDYEAVDPMGYDNAEIIFLSAGAAGSTSTSFSQEVLKLVVCNMNADYFVHIRKGTTVTTVNGFPIPPKGILPVPWRVTDVAAICATAGQTCSVYFMGLY